MDSALPESDNIARIRDILDPDSGGVRFPHLHEVLCDRRPDPSRQFSRCPHVFQVWSQGDGATIEARSDDIEYQTREAPEPMKVRHLSDMQITFNSVCGDVLDRLEVYGYLGQGCK